MSSPGWLIACGEFFFRYRNALFPAVILLVTVGMRPAVLFHDPVLDQRLGWMGMALATLGEAVRFTTIGFEYIERGGKNRKVWASRLVQRGVYGLSRNPMYAANLLIVLGVCLLFRAPPAFLTVVPAFVFIYRAITAAEERFLREKFGREFDAYCRRVPRFLPAMRRIPEALEGIRFDWRRALRQDLSTIVGVLFGMSLLPVWRLYRLEGWQAAQPLLPRAAVSTVLILLFYVTIYVLKKLRKME